MAREMEDRDSYDKVNPEEILIILKEILAKLQKKRLAKENA
jgi:hypothetical protein